ncbi:PAS domain-containing sensor histidine kinase [Carboxylicivirga marina]|uniref:histidine kinase n=1 Tax=Carboxylicivirga marina TaxID=2800988 RepID=A0ABS1HQ74_9BACT|nr:sensor histidine kinase [Carboxylicivirga marina]MBK3519833.1 PAS domain-containing sensor histidine kinase [Carboxylicivirga marina]
MNKYTAHNALFAIIVVLLVVVGILSVWLFAESDALDRHERIRHQSFMLADELKQSSDDLTRFCRTYTLTGDSIWETKYWETLAIRNGRMPRKNGRTISLQDSMQKLGFAKDELALLKEAEDKSNELVRTEQIAFNAMKGIFADSKHQFSITSVPDTLYAQQLLFDKDYHENKERIMTPITKSFNLLDSRTRQNVTDTIVRKDNILKSILLLIVIIGALSFYAILTLRKRIIKQLLKVNLLNTDLDNQVRKRTGELEFEKENLTKLNEELKKERLNSEQNEQNNKILFEILPIGLALAKMTGELVYINKAYTDIIGYSEKETLQLSYWDITPETYVKEEQQQLESLNKTGFYGPYEKEYRHKSGALIPVRLKGRTVVINGEAFIWSSVENISQKKKKEKELHLAKEKAEESERLKSAFLANMSHEIRTPMNSIIGFTELLKVKNLQEEQKNQYIEIINFSGNKLLSLISDIVDISKLDARQLTLSYGDCHLNKLIDNLQKQFKISNLNNNCEVKTSKGLSDTVCSLSTDELRLTQILSNLLENALKYTDNGLIEFGYAMKENMLEFFVKDNGKGIAPDDCKIIFDRFIQAENNHLTSGPGTGLGLSIVKSLTELLGGKAWVKSSLGKGSTFYFTIPYKNTKL